MPYNAEQNQQNTQSQDPNNQQPAQSGQVNLAGSGGSNNSTPNAGGSGRVAAFSSGAQQGSSGSGRYTNLQKYLGANQGATDRLYQGINNRINQTADPKKQEAATQADKVKEGIQQGSQALDRGTGYYNQMQDQNFNAQNFASDENRLNDYSQFRQGTVVDGTALNNQNTTAQAANMQAQDQYNQRLGQVGNEAGRFDLLKETFGGRNAYRPTYSAGSQRLDQLFLQSGAGNKIGQLQNDLRGNVNTLNQGLGNLQGKTVEEIKALQDQQSALSGNIQNKANTMETGYIDNIQGQVAGVNTGRDAERKKYNDFVQQILTTGQGKETDQALDGQLFDEARLREGEQTYNFLRNPTLTSQQFQNIDTRNAADYRDIANQGNVDYYGALSKLAGINNSKLNSVGQLIDPTTGGLNRAATLKTGDGSLRQGIDKAGEDFWNYAQGANITGEGSDSGTSGVFGSGGDANATAQANLADYLKNQGVNVNSTRTKESNVGSMVLDPTRTMGADLGDRVLAADPFTGGSPSRMLGDAVGSIGSSINSVTGANSGSSKAAQYRAQNALLGNLGSTLKDQGYNNYLTKSGVKNTDDLAAKQTAIAQDQLDIQTRDRYANLNMSPEDYAKDFASRYANDYTGYEGGNSLAGQNAYNSGLLKDLSGLGIKEVGQLQNLYNTDQNKYNELNSKYGSQGSLNQQLTAGNQYADRLNQGQQIGAETQKKMLAELNDKKASGQARSDQIRADMMKRLGLSDINLDTLKGDYYNK